MPEFIAADDDGHMNAPSDLLAAARSGDPAAFEQLISPFRGELQAHCYRMLGSLQDAEDVVQDSLLRAWRNVGGLDERGFVRAWLYKIATNRCPSALERRARRELPVDLAPGTPATEVNWLEPYPDRSPETASGGAASPESIYLALESIELAFIAALVTRWADAWQAGDVEAIVAMLTREARYSMPPLPEWYHGHADIRAFLLDGPLQSQWRFLPTTANGQFAFGTYLWDRPSGRYVSGGLDVLTIRGEQVAEITAFLTVDLTRFGLPRHLEP
jgi:RNA polymerase sigma-70 factor (ECF subfamily)